MKQHWKQTPSEWYLNSFARWVAFGSSSLIDYGFDRALPLWFGRRRTCGSKVALSLSPFFLSFSKDSPYLSLYIYQLYGHKQLFLLTVSFLFSPPIATTLFF